MSVKKENLNFGQHSPELFYLWDLYSWEGGGGAYRSDTIRSGSIIYVKILFLGHHGSNRSVREDRAS